MFGNRRRRAASNPPLNGSTASASATTAASQAFLRSQASNASLSAAAAAAALRSRPTTPISVADVQTKRTMKRAGSTSSVGSSGSGTGRGPPGSQLVRRGSSGSMTERTFRDPSPSRDSAPVPSAPNAPPVPAIPKSMQSGQPPMSTKAQRRAASLEAPILRVASPPPNKANGRGSSLGPNGLAPNPRRNGQRSSGLSSVQELTGVERPASRGSVNFSLPTGTRPMSPIGHKRLTSPSPQRANTARIISPTNQNLVYDPNTRSFLPEVELLAIEQRIQDAANRQIKQKKRAPAAVGSHFAEGTAGGRPRGTAIDAMEAAAKNPAVPVVELPAPVPAPEPVDAPVLQTQSPARKKKKKVIMNDSESDQGSYIPNSSDNDSDAAPLRQGFNNRASQILAKKPSVVREDREREEQEDVTPVRPKAQNGNLMADASPASNRTISPSPLPRSLAGRGHGRVQSSSSAMYSQEQQQTSSVNQDPHEFSNSTTNGTNGVGLDVRNSTRGGRVQSVSPARTTHFASSPESLVVKHQPPARSISPRKSALKHSFNSPRGPSPIEGGATTVGAIQDSETSIPSEDLSVPRKRANRVSFDESHVVVGQASSPVVTDSPIVNSPQNKRPWYSIGRGKKKDPSVVDDDEIMKPRPALPSFGSVRERKPSREVAEERPLVKPLELTGLPELKLSHPSPPLFTTPTGEVIEYPIGPIGQSNDHFVGAIFSQDATSKNEANISKSREPLPPQVTSVEGSGYHSESESSLYDVENTKSDLGVVRANSVKRGPEGVNAETYQALASPIQDLDTPAEEQSERAVNGTVPRIAVLAATPTVERTGETGEWPDMPGGWGSSTDEFGFREEETPKPIANPAPATVGVAEPSKIPPPITIPTINVPIPKSSPIAAPIMEESEESDASIYSDAAEDLSDTDGDGFMSLDAMVESPIVNAPVQGLTITTPPDSPITKLTKERAYQKDRLLRKDSEPDINEGWDKVQSYWSTLSADKKRQLEMEARQEDEGSDTEIEAKPAPKPKKKKKIVALLPPTVPLQPHPRGAAVTSDRTYMIQPGAKAGPNGHAHPMRSSMRSEPASTSGDTHIRKSMRGDGSMLGSSRTDPPEPRGSLQKKYRPLSLPASAIKADPVEVNKHIRALSIASARLAPSAAEKDMTQPAPALRRRGSGDSNSSFKRSRASSDAPAFRRSMRTSDDQEARTLSPTRSSRFSLRSLSPTGSTLRRPFSGTNGAPPTSSQTHMRSSMRNSFDVTPSLRSNNSPRMGGFGSSKGSKPAKVKASAPRSSRFADSSDEEDARPTFRSRFDSSDEDEPASKSPDVLPRTMRSAPVRGIPKRAGVDDGDSSDLPDSDDERPASSSLKLMKKRPQNGRATATTSQGSTLAAGSLRRSGSGRETIQIPLASASAAAPVRPTHTRRGSIMSILRRKKPDHDSKVRKSDIESAARRDTPLERSKSDLAAIRNDRPATPKLQKRNSDAWPLPVLATPPKITGEDDGRPFTANTDEGVTGAETNGNARPDIGTRRFTATGLAGVDVLGADGTGRKKKKFGKLRRMFKLDD